MRLGPVRVPTTPLLRGFCLLLFGYGHADWEQASYNASNIDPSRRRSRQFDSAITTRACLRPLRISGQLSEIRMNTVACYGLFFPCTSRIPTRSKRAIYPRGSRWPRSVCCDSGIGVWVSFLGPGNICVAQIVANSRGTKRQFRLPDPIRQPMRRFHPRL